MGAHAAGHEGQGQAWAWWRDLLCIPRHFPNPLSWHLPQGPLWYPGDVTGEAVGSMEMGDITPTLCCAVSQGG